MNQNQEAEYSVIAMAPFYLLKSTEDCYKCKKPSLIVAFAAIGLEGYEETSEELIQFSYVTGLPDWLKILLKNEFSNYYFDWSHTAGDSYYMNHCEHCGARFGDFFLHSEPDGAFFPQSQEEASSIEVFKLRNTGHVGLSADVSCCVASFIIEFGKKLTR